MFRLRFADLRAAPPGLYAHEDAPAPPAEPRPRTAIDHWFAPEGLVGSMGYGHLPDDRPIAVDPAGLATASGLGGPGGFVGASLDYSF